MPNVPRITSFLQCPKKKGRGKLDFLHAHKHQIFPEVETINFVVYGQPCPNYPENQKERRYEIDFFACINNYIKNKKFVQVNTIFFDAFHQACPKYPYKILFL